MKKKRYMFDKIAFLIIILLSFIFLCTKKTVNTEEKKIPAFVDTWSVKISPKAPFLTDTLTISLNIKEDSTYTLILTEHTGKILFSSKGNWSEQNDSIILTGLECKYLDTIPEPDTLSKLADSICNKSILLPLPEEREWNIPTAKFSIVLYSFPVSQDFVNLLPSIIPVITLTKESTTENAH